jgi:hypothetical protein
MVMRVLKAVPITHTKKNLFTIKAKFIMLFVEINTVYAENQNIYSP